MAELPPPPERRWWRRLPGRLERVGGLGAQLRGRFRPGRSLGEELWEETLELLLAADCGAVVAEELVEALRQSAARERWREPAQLLEGLRAEMARRLEGRERGLSLAGDPAVWLVVGVNGSGKTTTVAKLAARLQGQGTASLVAAADTFRAAAGEQLRALLGPLGVGLVAHRPGADPAAVVFDALAAARARGCQVVLVDTAGRLHTKQNLMQELGKVGRVVGSQLPGQPAEVLLTLDAYVGANALSQARVFGEVAGATGVVLTKLDGSARGGYVFQVESELGIPVKLVGTGEGPGDLADFEVAAYLDALLAEEGAPAGGG